MMDNLSLGKDFDEITLFLAEHRWMFDFKLTHIFQDCVFKNTPEEWKDTLKVLSGEQLTGLPFGHVQSTWPESLKLFIKRCMEFAFPREVTVSYTEQYHVKNGRVPAFGPCAANLDGKLQSLSNEASGLNERRETTLVTDGFTRFTPLDVCDLDADIKKGMSAKKLHEVCHMTSLIDHVTRVAGNNGVVDVGSGLGYLGHVLHSYYGHSVLGLEGKQGHTTGADKRLNKFACAGHLHNVTCELHADARSQQEFMILVKDWFSKLTRSRCSHQKTGSKSFPQTGSSQIQAKVSPAENIQIDKNRHADRNSSSERQNSLSASEQTGTLNTASDSLTGSRLSASEQTGTLNTASDSLTGSMLSVSELTGTLNTASDSLTGSMLSASEQTGTLNTASASLTGSMLPASELTGALNTASASLTGSMLSASELTSTQNTAANSVTGSKSSDCLQPASVSHSTVQICSDISKSQDFGGKLDSVHTTNECSEMPESCYNDRNVGKSAEKSEKTELSSGLETPQLCMAGLHCCGDLTPTMLKYFVELDAVTSLCCVSCCYHRMKYTEGSQEPQNFPMSKLFKESVSKTRKSCPDFTFSSYSLRLAAQETRARWREQTTEDHEFHMKNVAYRGILETCLQQDDKRFELKKCVRKLAHRDDYDSFSDYIDAVFRHIQTPQTVSEDSFRELFQSEMQKGYDLHHQYFCMIEPLTALQYLLQPVIESLIYQDRKQWLKEQGYHADIVPVFDELISPRNLAIVAYKNNCE